MPINQDKQKLLKKTAFFDLIIFSILAIPISILQLIIPILSSNLSAEILSKVSELNEFANYNRLLFLLFLILINLVYIFYFKHWKRLLYIFISGIFSAIAWGFMIFMVLIGFSRGNELTNSGLFLFIYYIIYYISLLSLVSIYPILHLFLAWKNYSRKEKNTNFELK